ncbi:MAG: tetratricopeptide repeat protein [Alphaproteobacteria bacterium]
MPRIPDEGRRPAGDAAERYRDGKKAIVERRFVDAARDFAAAVRAAPGNRVYWDHVAHALFLARRHRTEIAIRMAIVARFPPAGPADAANLGRIAALRFTAGDGAAAVWCLEQCLRHDPSQPRHLRELVWLLQHLDPGIEPAMLRARLNALRPLGVDEERLLEMRLRNRASLEATATAGIDPRRLDPPRVAVLISGQLRGYATALPGIRARLAQPLGADVFVHAWDTAGVPRPSRALDAAAMALLRQADIPVDDTLAVRFPQLETLLEREPRPSVERIRRLAGATAVVLEPEPESLRQERRIGDVRFPPAWSTYSVGSLPMFYKLDRCFALMEEHEAATGRPYDVVVRVRPDLVFRDRVPLTLLRDVLRRPRLFINGFTLGHFDDQFAIARRDVMARAARLFRRLPDFWMERGGLPLATPALGEQALFQHLFYEGVDVAELHWPARPSLVDIRIGPDDLRKVAGLDALLAAAAAA